MWKFLWLWPILDLLKRWATKTWDSLGAMALYSLGNGFFQFLFEDKESRDKTFKSRPYFMGSKELFLAPWFLDFHFYNEISVAPIWVKLSHFLLVLWDELTLKLIRDKLKSYIDHVEAKPRHFTCARIYVNLDI